MGIWKSSWKLVFATPGILIDCLTCWIILALNFVIIGRRIVPFSREFSDADPSLSQAHKGSETVSDALLIVLILIAPLVFFAISQVYCRSLMDMRIAFLTVCESITVASTFARWMKLTGRLRPDFLERYSTGNMKLIADGRMSFPSEHTTYSFASMVVVFWYMIGKSHIWQTSSPANFSFLGSIVCLLPIIVASYVGLTRTMDNVHHFSDIIAGALLGSFCGTFTYFINFPQPFHTHCHLPKILLNCNQDHKRP